MRSSGLLVLISGSYIMVRIGLWILVPYESGLWATRTTEAWNSNSMLMGRLKRMRLRRSAEMSTMSMVLFGDVGVRRILLVRAKILGSHQCVPRQGSICKDSSALWGAIFRLTVRCRHPCRWRPCGRPQREPEVRTSMTKDGTVVLHRGPDTVDPGNPSPGKTFHLVIGLICINLPRADRLFPHSAH